MWAVYPGSPAGKCPQSSDVVPKALAPRPRRSVLSLGHQLEVHVWGEGPPPGSLLARRHLGVETEREQATVSPLTCRWCLHLKVRT